MRNGMVFLVACVSLSTLSVEPAQAASAITFVSGNGNNSNDCLTPATACRELGAPFSGGAQFKTSPGGTIHVLPGVYQPFEVYQGRNILADQGQASINGSIETASSINVGRASILVDLGNYDAQPLLIRGFTFAGQDSGIAIFDPPARIVLSRVQPFG
jgi:hypothetical protein